MAHVASELERVAATRNGVGLHAAWIAEIGELGRIIELRVHQRRTLDARQPEDWHRLGAVMRTESKLLDPVIDYQHPKVAAGNVYEWRRYRALPGRIEEWLGHFVSVLPTRQRYSQCLGLWRTVGGVNDEVNHLWVYAGLDERAKVKAAVAEDSEWQRFLEKGPPLITEMHSTVLLPARYSPIK